MEVQGGESYKDEWGSDHEEPSKPYCEGKRTTEILQAGRQREQMCILETSVIENTDQKDH